MSSPWPDDAEQVGPVLDDDAVAGPDEPADDVPDLEVPEPPVTGDAGVDEATARVAAAARRPLDEQVQAFDAAHRTLQDRLADVDG